MNGLLTVTAIERFWFIRWLRWNNSFSKSYAQRDGLWPTNGDENNNRSGRTLLCFCPIGLKCHWNETTEKDSEIAIGIESFEIEMREETKQTPKKDEQKKRRITSKSLYKQHNTLKHPNNLHVIWCVQIQKSKTHRMPWGCKTPLRSYYVYVFVIIFVYYSRILQSTVFLVSIRCKAVPTVRAHIWFILLYYFMIPQLLYMLMFSFPPIYACACACVNTLLSCICHIAIKFININCLQLLQKHIVYSL